MITLYDTATGSLNLGDQIIMQAVIKQLEVLFEQETFIQYPTHYPMSKYAANKAWKNSLAFVGGTNILQSHWEIKPKKNQWAIGFFESFKMQPAILFGCGWQSYNEKTTFKAKKFYENSLSSKFLHSVRDSYTVERLKQIGVKNVLNTACPTMWGMDRDFIDTVRTKKSNTVVFTLTDYNKNYDLDVKLIKILLSNYNNIYFWPQGHEDLSYFKELSEIDNHIKRSLINILPHNLNCYDDLLLNEEVDFVGTRLHAGIRAIQHKQRSIIIGIDNRALEMSKDFDLPVVNRTELGYLEEIIVKDQKLNISIPVESINKWRNQFYYLNFDHS
ncbi:polysaccharide pyruvyl transferase family protein [Acinetobacter towneri]|uniref:polysaccharide pyruvyl transferase family protein n=1 Tax=Acinetobacter towneri TaxID=202956 RepID=UPI003212171F